MSTLEPKLKDITKICLVVGDVHNKSLIEDIWKAIKNSVNYQFVEIYHDLYKQKKSFK